MLRLYPIPGQQLVEPRGGVIGHTGEHVGEPDPRVDVVELGGSDRGANGGRPFATAIRAANSQTRRPRATPRGAFGGVVTEADAAVVDKAREGQPASLSNIGATDHLADTAPVAWPMPRS